MPHYNVCFQNCVPVIIVTPSRNASSRKFASVRRKTQRMLEQKLAEPCLSAEEIRSYASVEKIDPAIEKKIQEHIEICPACDLRYSIALLEHFS